MQRIKNAVYEHRFGLFFFMFLSICCFYAFEGFLSTDLNTTLSVYAVDFSIGFCNKLLPGAIFNAIFDNTSIELVSGYIQMLIYICFIFIALLAEKFIYSFSENDRKNAWILSVLILLCFSVLSYQGIMFLLLDMHWLLSLVLLLFFMSYKKFYVLIPLPFLYAITVHYGSAMCYIPLFVLIMLVKIYYCKSKKERCVLWGVLSVSFIAAVVACLYFVTTETDNMKITVEQMHALLESRGVKSFDFYDAYFDPKYTRQRAIDLYGENIPEWVISDEFRFSIDNFFPYLFGRIKWHLMVSDHRNAIVAAVTALPMVLFILGSLFKRKEKNSSVRCLNLLAVALSLEVIAIGLIMSEDSERWVGHSVICLMVYFAYLLFEDDNLKKRVNNLLGKLSPVFLMFVFMIGFLLCRI